ncbi:hypothetical protein KTN05_15565 [Paracoccus sp. Z118]|uniref:hypothetical protein n=1 Tax=Paracoccus sp. Z118 TaxID=2851017 RepID=UPI001C2C31C4|nr:hypothetical protein [Paracoccus sp. Z118]MBV0893231.1 hypothetical protein [Paracoccus sp. Z118]
MVHGLDQPAGVGATPTALTANDPEACILSGGFDDADRDVDKRAQATGPVALADAGPSSSSGGSRNPGHPSWTERRIALQAAAVAGAIQGNSACNSAQFHRRDARWKSGSAEPVGEDVRPVTVFLFQMAETVQRWVTKS